MNSVFTKYQLLFLGGSGCSCVVDSNRLDASKYLSEAQSCFSGGNPITNDDLNLPKDLNYKLSVLEAIDYVGEKTFKSGEVLINLQKIIDGKPVSIELGINPSQNENLSKISVHEILAER